MLDEDDPAVRHLALRLLLDEPEDAPVVRRARAKAMRSAPIVTILDRQDPAGYWDKPGPGYGRKYKGTVWSLIFLDQLGAEPSHPGVRAACAYVLEHTQAANGGFGASGRVSPGPPPSSSVYHCLNGNLLRALLGFGWLDDPRVRRSLAWQARSITGEGFDGYEPSGTTSAGFACAVNDGNPCPWGAIKALRALARVPARRRAPYVAHAIRAGVDFLLSRDPMDADYPTGTPVSPYWFRLGFPSGYIADVLQNLEVLAELGRARDPRLERATEWLLSLQDANGRWRNANAYRGRLWADVDAPRAPSKWVTLRACAFLRAALG